MQSSQLTHHPKSIIQNPAFLGGLLLLALGAVEGLAYWWMHPKPAGLGEPVLVYRPHGSAGVPPADQKPGVGDQQEAKDTAQSSTSKFNVRSSKFDVPSSTSDLRPPTLDSSSSSLTPLPGIYAKSAPMLRCSSGQVLLATPTDSLSLHLAFFEWDGTDTGSVLEAFRHMPEACMGSIGMILIEKAPPRNYVVRGQETEDRRQTTEDRSQEEATAQHPTSTFDVGSWKFEVPSSIQNSKSNIQNSKLATQSLSFDHTIFRDPRNSAAPFTPPVHAFRAVWVSGLAAADARQGLAGEQFDRLRSIRLKSALTRFKPAHARVIQGVVRGATNADAAWKAFEQTMLADLRME